MDSVDITLDVSLANMALGAYVKRRILEGADDDEILPLKKAYIRLRWALVDLIPLSLEESQERAVLLREHALQGGSVSPDWLPCHKTQSLLHSQPCNQLSKSCRCAEQLQCELVEFSLPLTNSPNVELTSRASRGLG